MKVSIQLLMAFIILMCGSCQTTKDNKVDTQQDEIAFADPTIFVENNKYYLTGTRNRTPPQGFSIFESTNLEDWKTANGDTLQLILREGDSAYGERGFWAPQIFKEGEQILYDIYGK